MSLDIIKCTIDETCKLLDTNLLYLENHYRNVLAYMLLKRLPDYSISQEVPINYCLKNGFVFGYGRIDIVLENIDNIYILELKANVSTKQMNVDKYLGQLRRYLHHLNSPKNKVGMLIIFNPGETKIITEMNLK